MTRRRRAVSWSSSRLGRSPPCCGFGLQNFGAVLALPNGVSTSQTALSSMLSGVTIDGSWVLTPAQLAKLINVFGGINVDVDTNVVQHTSKGGVIVVPAGSNEKLNGTQAVEYALYNSSPSAGAAAQLARMNRVLDATFQALPTTPASIAAALRQLGPGGTSSLGATKLSTLLAGLAADSRSASGLFPTDLPVKPIDSGGASPSYGVDTVCSGQLVHTQLAAPLPKDATGSHASVWLLNGVGTPGLVQTACPRLTAPRVHLRRQRERGDLQQPDVAGRGQVGRRCRARPAGRARAWPARQ